MISRHLPCVLLLAISLLLLSLSTTTATAPRHENRRFLQSSGTTMVQAGTLDLTTCTPAPSQFNIDVRYMGSGDISERYQAAMTEAAARWMKIIIGDLPDAPPLAGGGDWFGGQFGGANTYSGAVDDVVIGYDFPATIDGPGGQLGGAGPIFVRQTLTQAHPISGVMIFDAADLDALSDMDVKTIILHEMGHVLGLVGTADPFCTGACNPNAADARAPYLCPAARTEYTTIVNEADDADEESVTAGLILENQGGMSTACGHWEEDSFRTDTSSELMTGFFEPNMYQPISSVTVAGLQDLGYVVDFCGADVWPATDDSAKQWEVLRSTSTMPTMGEGVLDAIPPEWALDPETGEMMEWSEMMATAALYSDNSTDTSSNSGTEEPATANGGSSGTDTDQTSGATGFGRTHTLWFATLTAGSAILSSSF